MYWENIRPIYEILLRGDINLAITDRTEGGALCWGGTVDPCAEKQNDLYDFYVY